MSDREFEDLLPDDVGGDAGVKVPGTKAPVTGEPLRELLREVSEGRGVVREVHEARVPAPVLSELPAIEFRGTMRESATPRSPRRGAMRRRRSTATTSASRRARPTRGTP